MPRPVKDLQQAHVLKLVDAPCSDDQLGNARGVHA